MSKTFSFSDAFSYEGYWWMPDNKEEQIAGTLTFDQEDGIVLKVLGIFGGIESFNRDQSERSTIHGMTKEGKQITIFDAFSSSRQLNAPGIFNEQYRGHLLCVGYHFLDADQTLFDKSYFRFEKLEEWLEAAPFQQTWTYDPIRLNLNVEKQPYTELTSFDGYTIGKSTNMNVNSSTLTDYGVKVLSFLNCETAEVQSLNHHFRAASRLQELASLCTGHYLPLTHLTMQVHGTGSTESPPQQIDVYAQLQHPDAGKRPKHEAPLFLASELLIANDKAIANWFVQYEVLSPAISLFFAVTGGKWMYTNVRFLLAIQALEVFHRRTEVGVLMEGADFKKLRKDLAKAIPVDVPSAIKDKLVGLYAFANEPSLLQRLDGIILALNKDFDEKLAGFSGDFSKQVRDTRNYNTHFTAILEKKAMDGGEMWWASRRIIALLTYLFLKNIGIGSTAFRTALERHREFRSLFVQAGTPV